MEPKISAVLLAAGLSQRMGKDKLLLEYGGTTILQHAVGLLAALPVYERIVVTTKERLDRTVLPEGVRPLLNPHPETGLSGSVRMGLGQAAGDWFFFMMADQPLLAQEDVLTILKYASDTKDKIIYPVIDGKPCTPTMFASCFREELLSATGDNGGRTVREAHPEACIEVFPEHPESFLDIDSELEYLQILSEEGFNGCIFQ